MSMDFLARESADLSPELWKAIDETVVKDASSQMVGRRFLPLFGPVGPGAESVVINYPGVEEVLEDGVGSITGQKIVRLNQIYQDFSLLWRNLEYSKAHDYPVDLSSARDAALKMARAEDKMIFFGNERLGVKGLFNEEGIQKLPRSDWSEKENDFTDIAKGIMAFSNEGLLGSKYLILSPDLYVQLQRLQPNVGMLEIDRIEKLVGNKVLNAPVLGPGKAMLVCAEPEFMDLALGVDLSTAYLEFTSLNHYFRILETLALRLREPRAVIVYE